MPPVSLLQSCQTNAENFMGGRRATVLAPEVRLLSDCLYFGMTSLSGTQTLGEEFVSALRVSARKEQRDGREVLVVRPLSTSKRVVVCSVQVLYSYIARRFEEGWHPLRQELGLPSSEAAFREADAAALEALRVRGILPRPAGADVDERVTGARAARRANVRAGRVPAPVPGRPTATSPHYWPPVRSFRDVPALAIAFKYHLWRLSAKLYLWASRHLTTLAGRVPIPSAWLWWALRVAGRVHRAVFFLTGHFFDPAMRLAGVYYVLHRAQAPGLPDFRPLGILMLGGMGFEAFSWTLGRIRDWWRQRSQRSSRRSATEGGGGAGESKGNEDEDGGSDRDRYVLSACLMADAQLTLFYCL